MKSSVFTAAAVVFANTTGAAPVVVREVTARENVGDKAVLPIYYVIIAGAKENDAHQITARQLDVSKDDKEQQNSIILFIGGAQGDKRDLNAYSDYIKDANPKEILGE